MENIYNRDFFESVYIGNTSYDELERDEAYLDYYDCYYSGYPQEDPRDYGSYDYFDCMY